MFDPHFQCDTEDGAWGAEDISSLCKEAGIPWLKARAVKQVLSRDWDTQQARRAWPQEFYDTLRAIAATDSADACCDRLNAEDPGNNVESHEFAHRVFERLSSSGGCHE